MDIKIYMERNKSLSDGLHFSNSPNARVRIFEYDAYVNMLYIHMTNYNPCYYLIPNEVKKSLRKQDKSTYVHIFDDTNFSAFSVPGSLQK